MSDRPTDEELKRWRRYFNGITNAPIAGSFVVRLIDEVRRLRDEVAHLTSELADAARTIKAIEDDYDERFCQP